MIDHLVAKITEVDSKRILNSGKFPMIREYFERTDVLSERGRTTMPGFRIEDNAGIIRLSGSLHTFKNMQKHKVNNNSGPFSLIDIIGALHEISCIFETPLTQFKIHSLEFGVNFTPKNFEELHYLRTPVVQRNKAFFPMDSRNGKSIGKHVKHKNYRFKLYNKTQKLRQSKESFYPVGKIDEARCEVNFVRMEMLRKVFSPATGNQRGGFILTLEDLMRIEVYEHCKGILKRVFRETIFYEDINSFTDLSSTDREFVLNMNNPLYYEAKQIREDQYTNDKRKFDRLLKTKCKNSIKESLWNNIDQTIDSLIYCEESSSNSFTFFDNSSVWLGFLPIQKIIEQHKPTRMTNSKIYNYDTYN